MFIFQNMKKIVILFIISLIAFQVDAQIKFGIMTGKSMNHIPKGELNTYDGVDSFLLDIHSPNSPWLFGPYLRLQRERVFFQCGILLGYSTVDYGVKNLTTADSTTIRDSEWNLSIPIEIGVFLDDRVFIKGGILGANYFQHEKENALLSFDNKLFDIFRDKKIGYRIGLGIELQNESTFSLSYGNFRDIQDFIVVNNKVDYDFDVRQHQLMVNFNWSFIKQ